MDVRAEVGVGAEEVEGTALLVLDRADLEPALVMTGADHIFGAFRVEHFVDFALRELHHAVGVLIVNAYGNEEILRGLPYSVGEGVVAVDDRLSVVLDVMLFYDSSHVWDETLEHPLALILVERAVVSLCEYFPHSER